MNVLLAAALLFFAFGPQTAPSVSAGEAGVASFHLDWAEAPVPHWSIEVKEDGSGSYETASDSDTAAAGKRTIVVGVETLERLRAGYKAVVEGRCETKIKGLAKIGAKHMAYTAKGSDAWSSCTFNYSDDRALMDAVAAFQAVAETIQIGGKLQYAHRYDRLSLDAEIDRLEAEARDGHAIEMQNIAPALQSIIDDERVIERARRKAARLLQSAEPVAVSAR